MKVLSFFLQLRISMYSHLMAAFVLKWSREFLWKQSKSLPFPQIQHFVPPLPSTSSLCLQHVWFKSAFLRHLVQDCRSYAHVYYTVGHELEKPVPILGFIYNPALIFKISQPFSLTWLRNVCERMIEVRAWHMHPISRAGCVAVKGDCGDPMGLVLHKLESRRWMCDKEY